MPAQFPWPTQWQCEVAFDCNSPLTVAYAKMWHTIERQAATIHAHQGRVIEAKFFGRGRTLCPRSKTTNGAPCKVGREGEDHPTFFGRSTKHLRWFKQLRRFQALARLPNNPNSMTSVHKAEIWRAIRHATGFEGGFSKWWVINFPEGAFEGGLPIIVPEQSQIVDMYHAFRCKVRDFERSLKQVRISEAKQKRLDDVSLIFKDCPKEQPTQVDTLIDARVETITEVNQDDSSIVLAGPIKLMPDTPVIARGKSLDIIYHDHDQLWLANVEELECGDQIRQEKITASDRDILQEFQRVWEGRWVKPAHLLSSQWEQLVGFLRQVVRPITWSFADWSGEGLRKIVKAKKKRSATGPDGVSRHDLVNLPDTGINAIVGMFKCIEEAGQWPKQLQVGIVKSLDKNKGANGVDGFRPITIYPLLYRAWSSFRAKQALKVLATVVPNSVRGGLPSRQSKTIWYEVSQLIESAHHSGTALAGVVLDIRRAFNALPRIPLWEMLQLLSFPPKVLKTWAAFVSGQVRRFRVRQSTGDEIQSCVGLPEGCAMSVFRMALVDWCLDLWLGRMYQRPSELYSYVDDWQVLFQNATDFQELLGVIRRFSNMLDLELDISKSYVWATCGSDRAQLRNSEIVLVNAARDLGAHQNFTKHAGNKTLQQRIAQTAEIWPLLRKSLCPYKSKILGIKQIGWPKALYGASIVHLGSQHYEKLRTGASRALRANRIGAHPALHLWTESPFLDPECWTIRQTLLDARTLGNIEQCRSLWIQMFQVPGSIPRNGPAAILAVRLAKLGWCLTANGTWVDEIGEFCPLVAHWQAVQFRIQFAWSKYVATYVAHRSCFAGVQHADGFLTSKLLQKFGEADRVFIKCALDGTLYTDTFKTKEQRGAHSQCVFCGQNDGFYHRLWQCEHFKDARVNFQWSSLLDVLPRSMTCHGWAMQPPTWKTLLQQFEQLPLPAFRHFPKIAASQTVDLFTDGTCQHPTEPRLRYAGWAVTLASPFRSVLDHVAIGAGHVPGLQQSSFRAEVWALKIAIQFVVQHGCSARIWCDCQSVVDKLQRILSRGGISSGDVHFDLWSDIQQLLQGDVGRRVQIGKVASHCDFARATSATEEWAFWHNQLVDNAAHTANMARSDHFWRVWEQVRWEQQFSQLLTLDTWEVILRASKLDTKRRDNFDQDACNYFQSGVDNDDGSGVEANEHNDSPEGNDVSPGGDMADSFSARFLGRHHRSNLQPIFHWWSTVGHAALRSEAPVKWVSGLQLYVDFVFFSAVEGPTMVRGKWIDRANATLMPHREETVTRRVKMFVTFWKAMLKELRVVIPAKMQRAHSAATTYWGQCYRLKWPKRRCDLIDDYLLQVLGRQIVQPHELGYHNFIPVPEGNGLQQSS